MSSEDDLKTGKHAADFIDTDMKSARQTVHHGVKNWSKIAQAVADPAQDKYDVLIASANFVKQGTADVIGTVATSTLGKDAGDAIKDGYVRLQNGAQETARIA